jgi:very-short-patch-repair endonuclease
LLAVQDVDNAELTAVLAAFQEARSRLSQFIELAEPHLASADAALDEIANAATEMLAAVKLHGEIGGTSAFKELCGDCFAGVQTDLSAVGGMLGWIEKIQVTGLSKDIIAWMLIEHSAPDRAEFLFENLNKCLDEFDACEKALKALADFGEINVPEFLGGITTSQFGEASKRISGIKNQFDLLPAWANYSRSVERSKHFGLSPFVLVASSGEVPVEQLANIYAYAFFNALVRESIHQAPILAEFSRISHESVRERFQKIDHDLKALRQREIAHRIGSNQQLPHGISTGPVSQRTEMGFILNEIGKQKRHAPIRLLIHRAGEALAVLKPCFMMSPLSAAQFLAPGVRAFDMVVMDEASQLKPEDALGAIARTGQLIVVGDPKQLPPTAFFDKMADEETESDEDTAADDAESILEVCMKVYSPMRRLRWHYRSEHESLIAFSNHAFYDRDLIIFPSATSDNGRLGIRFHQIENGAYAKGRNLPEAEQIAKAIVAHAQQHPNESLGVGAFNISQKELIEECLDRICRNDGSAREAVDKLSAHPEKLFIKNLENLQGDQRDVIFISYTFGPDPETKRVFQRFGPINSENGWRRLNVMFTRAKKRMEVFSSMSPEDIIGGPSVKRGVNDFKRFLEYASTGRIIDPGEITDRTPDSDFEMAVAETVRSMGYQVRPQVGVAGFYIDVAVLRPNRSDEFILGIECDGETYHSAKSARDRDRLREEILRRRGWNIHRVWSTDWFKNQTAETTRLKETLERLCSL